MSSSVAVQVVTATVGAEVRVVSVTPLGAVPVGPQGPAGADGPPGDDGAQGPQGDPGEGVPTGGTAGQVLTKDSGTDFDTSWQDPTGGSGGTVDVVSNVATSRILGRTTAGSGDSEELTAAQVRTLLNVEDGATADMSAAEILAALLTVDGAGSGLDADLLDGQSSAAFATAAQGTAADAAKAKTDHLTVTQAVDLDTIETKVAGIEAGADVTDAANVAAAGAVMESDYDANTVLKADSDNTPTALTMGASTILARLAAGGIVAATPAQLRTLLNVEDGATADQSAAEILAALLTVDGAGSGLDADTLDGVDAGSFVRDSGDETIAGVKTFSSDPIIPDEAYDATAWNGSLEPPTKNAIRDKIETMGGASVSDVAYDATSWNGVTDVAPSKNAVRDQIEALAAIYAPLASPALTGNPTAPTQAQGNDSTRLATTAFVNAEIAADAAPKDLGGVLTSATTTLSNTTPNSLTYVQWGTEEAVVAQADAPASAVVLAFLTGSMETGAGSIAAGDRGSCKVQVSFDGGSNFADFASSDLGATLPITTSLRRYTVARVVRATGTVTGDIQVRAMVEDVSAANDTTWSAGIITVMVHPQ